MAERERAVERSQPDARQIYGIPPPSPSSSPSRTPILAPMAKLTNSGPAAAAAPREARRHCALCNNSPVQQEQVEGKRR